MNKTKIRWCMQKTKVFRCAIKKLDFSVWQRKNIQKNPTIFPFFSHIVEIQSYKYVWSNIVHIFAENSQKLWQMFKTCSDFLLNFGIF